MQFISLSYPKFRDFFKHFVIIAPFLCSNWVFKRPKTWKNQQGSLKEHIWALKISYLFLPFSLFTMTCAPFTFLKSRVFSVRGHSTGHVLWKHSFLKKFCKLNVVIPNPGVPCSKPLGGSKVDSVFHPFDINKMSTKNFWELSGKKLTVSSKWL